MIKECCNPNRDCISCGREDCERYQRKMGIGKYYTPPRKETEEEKKARKKREEEHNKMINDQWHLTFVPPPVF